ncbi:L,D-transpeptidase family protein [Foetidibacter luteolus]|uniref:L,D-transpeptidase family protein n=1 Tax=Foetidibacter luteolus TaxID=2608880 RepID=UPI00129AC536|nr:L,D-transpeptidase family protein [Foetidibacter luteolus]
MKQLLATTLILSISIAGFSQSSFIDFQRTYPRVAQAVRIKEDTLKKQFAAAGLQWPAKQMYVRSFKYDSQLEVWVRNNINEPFKLFKTYKVCAMAGALGPKRMEGDYQVPEGFYYINQFNPKSSYHLSLGLNYPNVSDKILSDSEKPGGGIYIHGSCVTVGCIPIQDPQIEELYVLAANAKNNGQDYIPVHIFPVRFSNPKSMEFFDKATKDDQDIQKFTVRLKEVYDYFEKEKKLPLISISKTGDYIVTN